MKEINRRKVGNLVVICNASQRHKNNLSFSQYGIQLEEYTLLYIVLGTSFSLSVSSALT
jgi:hypothetical protein